MRRRGGELVDEDVPALGLLGVAGERARLGRRLGVDHLDVDLRADAASGHDLAQAQRVAADGVAAVQHRDELVDAAHDRACAPLGQGRPAGRRSGRPRSRDRARPGAGAPPRPWRRGGARRPAARRWTRPARRGPCPRRATPAPPSTSGTAPWSKATTGSAGRHRLDHRHAEALVLGRDDQHVGVGVGRRDGGVARVAGEADRAGQAQLGHVAVQRGDVGVRRRLADDVQRRLRVAVGPGHGERGDGALERLVGRDPPDGQPARAAARSPAVRRPSRRGRRRGHGGVERRRRRDDRRGGEPRLGQVRLVVGRVGDGQRGRAAPAGAGRPGPAAAPARDGCPTAPSARAA